MSFYFTIISPSDVPLFSAAFGSFKAGGDGIARFRYPADSSSRYMNQFLVHASLDILEEVQWRNGAMYLRHIDTYPPASCFISSFLTGSGARFLLLHQPVSSSSGLSNNNPLSPQMEESIRQFMNEVYENWVKTMMSPFHKPGSEIISPVFRAKVLTAARRWL